jgi:hypothetical protein
MTDSPRKTLAVRHSGGNLESALSSSFSEEYLPVHLLVVFANSGLTLALLSQDEITVRIKLAELTSSCKFWKPAAIQMNKFKQAKYYVY